MDDNQKNIIIKDHQKDLNCFTLIVGKGISATGNVMVAHNEDDPGNVVSFNGYVSKKDWPKESFLPAENGHAQIPQIEHTYGFYWTEFCMKDGGLSCSDSYFNDNGVLIVSNGCNCSKEDLSDNSRLTDGGIEGNLRRILAERAVSARHALDIAMSMIEKYGYVPAGRAYTMADKNEAYMMQIVSGKHYIAVRVPDDMVAVMPNHYTLRKLNDFPKTYFPKDFIDYAINKGWYKPKSNNYEDFDFIKVYADDKSMHKPANIYRSKHAFSLLLNKEYDPNDKGFLFGCYPDHNITQKELVKILASHYEGTSDNVNFVGPGESPHHSDIRRLCWVTTIHSLICEFNDEDLFTRLWTCPGRPCSIPFLPHHPYAGFPKSLNNMKNPNKNLEEHYLAIKEKMFYQNSNWQKFKDFSNKLDMLFCDVYENFSKKLDEINNNNIKRCKDSENKASDLILHGCLSNAKELLCSSDEKCINQNLEDLKTYENKHFNICKCKILLINKSKNKVSIKLMLNSSEQPREDTLVFGLSGTNISDSYSKCEKDTLQKYDENNYTVMFNISIFSDELTVNGRYACMLGGRTIKNKVFASLVILTWE